MQRMNDDYISARAVECLDLARANRIRLAVAESCSGGMIGAALSAIAGASESFVGGMICYADSVKRLLGVDASMLDEYGAVSEQVAIAMSGAAMRMFEVDLAVAVTGIAGPHGATDAKPSGLVHLAVCAGASVEHRRRLFTDRTRRQVRECATIDALALMCFMMRRQELIRNDARPRR